MTFLANRYFKAIATSFILIGTGLFGSCTEFGLSLFEAPLIASEEPVIDQDDLTDQERIVYNQLGPVYRRIFLYALTNDQRRRVVIYVCRGLTPFEAVNVVLRAEQRKMESGRNSRRTLTPGERAALGPSQRKHDDVTG